MSILIVPPFIKISEQKCFMKQFRVMFIGPPLESCSASLVKNTRPVYELYLNSIHPQFIKCTPDDRGNMKDILDNLNPKSKVIWYKNCVPITSARTWGRTSSSRLSVRKLNLKY